MFEKLGKFEIKRVLGQGAMGEVYLGTDPSIGRDVAIKTILPSAATGKEAKERFAREAKAAGVLNHPNLVTIYEFGEDQGVLFIAMEYVRGHDLEELMREQALTRSESLEILAQLCDGLAFAHQNHIVHRDIKPSNVRVFRDGKRLQAKVMDFGVARVGNSDMTATGMVMGTVSYMAPEYIRTGKPDPRSDLFAVGVMLYEALSGRKPFSGDTTPTILYKIVNEPPEPIDLSQIQGISPAIRSVLDRSLDKDPDQRYQTADELARALRAAKDPTWAGTVQDGTVLVKAAAGTPPAAAAGGADPTLVQPMAAPTAVLPHAVPPPPLPRSAPPRPPTAGSNNGMLIAVGGLAALVLLGGGGFALWKWKQGQEAPVVTEQPAASGPVTAAINSEPLPPTPAPAEPAAVDPGAKQMPTGPYRPRTPEPAFEGAPSRAERARPPQEQPQERPTEPTRAPSSDPFSDENLGKLDAADRKNLGRKTFSDGTAIAETDPARAVRILRNAIAADPYVPNYYSWAVVILYRQQRYKECREMLDLAQHAGIGRGQMMANARFRSIMNNDSLNHRIPD